MALIGLRLEMIDGQTGGFRSPLERGDHLVHADFLPGDIGHTPALADKDNLRSIVEAPVDPDHIIDIIAIEPGRGREENVILLSVGNLVDGKKTPGLWSVPGRFQFINGNKLHEIGRHGQDPSAPLIGQGDGSSGLAREIAHVTHRHRSAAIRIEPVGKACQVVADGTAFPAADQQQ